MEPGELWRSSCDVWVMGKARLGRWDLFHEFWDFHIVVKLGVIGFCDILQDSNWFCC